MSIRFPFAIVVTAALTAALLNSACKRRVSSALDVAADLSGVIDLANYQEVAKVACAQKILVVYVGHADLPATYYIPRDAKPEVKGLLRTAEANELEVAKLYHQTLLAKQDNLAASLARDEGVCGQLGVKRGAVMMVAVTDGPTASDTKISTRVFHESAGTWGADRAYGVKFHKWLGQDLVGVTAADAFELSIPKSLGGIMNAAAAMGPSVGEGGPFTQALFLFKSHGAQTASAATPRIKSLLELIIGETSAELTSEYYLGEKWREEEFKKRGTPWVHPTLTAADRDSLLAYGQPKFGDSPLKYINQLDDLTSGTGFFYDIHGADQEIMQSDSFSPLWTNDSVCLALKAEKVFADHLDCARIIAEFFAESQREFRQGAGSRNDTQGERKDTQGSGSRSETQGPRGETQGLRDLLISAAGFSLASTHWTKETQSHKNGFIQAAAIVDRRLLDSWLKMPFGPDAFYVYGDSMQARKIEKDQRGVYALNLPVAAKSENLWLHDSCYADGNIGTSYANFFDKSSLPRLEHFGLTRLFNIGPLYIEALDYSVLNVRQLAAIPLGVGALGRQQIAEENQVKVEPINTHEQFPALGKAIRTFIEKQGTGGASDPEKDMFSGIVADSIFCSQKLKDEQFMSECWTPILSFEFAHRLQIFDGAQGVLAAVAAYRRAPTAVHWVALAPRLWAFRRTVSNTFAMKVLSDPLSSKPIGNVQALLYNSMSGRHLFSEEAVVNEPRFKKVILDLHEQLAESHLKTIFAEVPIFDEDLHRRLNLFTYLLEFMTPLPFEPQRFDTANKLLVAGARQSVTLTRELAAALVEFLDHYGLAQEFALARSAASKALDDEIAPYHMKILGYQEPAALPEALAEGARREQAAMGRYAEKILQWYEQADGKVEAFPLAP